MDKELLEKVKLMNQNLKERTNRNLRSELRKVVEIDELSFNSLKKDIDDKLLETVSVEVLSTKGNIFMNNQIDTILYAKIYSGMKEITDSIPEEYFKWSRVSSDLEGDKIWNESHTTGKRKIQITSADVINKATFQLDVEIIKDYLKNKNREN